jgi:hypothetical protein
MVRLPNSNGRKASASCMVSWATHRLQYALLLLHWHVRNKTNVETKSVSTRIHNLPEIHNYYPKIEKELRDK